MDTQNRVVKARGGVAGLGRGGQMGEGRKKCKTSLIVSTIKKKYNFSIISESCIPLVTYLGRTF